MKPISKHITITSLFFIMAFIMPSCKDFLEEDPKDRVSIDNYYKTQEDAISAVNAIYSHLNSQSGDTFGGVYHSSFWVTVGLASDEMLNNQAGEVNAGQLSDFTYTPDNGLVFDVWKQHYKAITLANIAIERIPGISMDETLRTRLVNEAKFLRGLLYFDMVRMFGKIPLLLKEVEPLTPPVAEVEEIYTQIIADLTDAEALPAEQADGRGRATSGAAKAILAKVYLTRKEYDKCADKALEVINTNDYELWDDYADVFKINNRGGKEAIFSIGFGDAGGGISFWEVAQFNVRLLPKILTDSGVTNNTQGWQVPTSALAAAYDTDDERAAVTVFNKFDEDGKDFGFDKYYFRKYWDRDVEPKAEGSVQDFPLIRYADVLLMYAEASNEDDNISDAHDYVNMVRNRANLSSVAGLTKDQLRDEILEQRRLEFAAEGHRWFDLVRTNKLETLVPLAKGVTPEAKHYLFPIPQRERDLNENLPTNGY
jgi:hypothetical protein